MRYALVALVLLGTLAMPASAVTVDPKQLVLAPSDVPAGFRIDSAETGIRTNELEGKEYPETRPLFRRWRRVIGYQVSYRRKGSSIEARADLFRAANGAHELQDWADREYRKSGMGGLMRERAGIGSESVVYWGGGPSGHAVVIWRYQRVWAGIAGIGLGRQRTLALARVQQRRIVAALG
jgi:hypothetical protein